MESLETSFDELLVLITGKQNDLENVLVRFELESAIAEQILWCQEKTILAKKEETGSDLAQAESFNMKHKELYLF